MDAAIALTDLVWNELIASGNGGKNTLDEGIALAQRALKATLDRIGIPLKLP
ncbi:hypothetical protein IU443_12865 [Nocardia farcinica]|uniref:hypothetical protein n=1 Tax=Nocardia farcinica TaxID=37329 RepID=UPI0018934D97|nr:hypothetical protein [Nocardia farcinica]MBF6250209.1 hypothetical protein [Nocardia farcinica]MBF6262447.1 hypothetical protein [Nocardia farcinica]MBF6280987.1 hypothetical protein [Nocardia farcinica]MBF6304556.1 hypothetical protein [Nocardia farcinica]MBF6390840.1 hypothetical protein [Nocardia farcinica]